MDHGRLMMDGTPEEVFARGEELKEMGLALPAPWRSLPGCVRRALQWKEHV